MAPISADAAKALALMPVPVLKSDIDPEEEIEMIAIKFTHGALAAGVLFMQWFAVMSVILSRQPPYSTTHHTNTF